MCSRGLAAHGNALVCDGHQVRIDVDDGPLDKVAQGLILKQLDNMLGVGVDSVGAEGDGELLAERHSGLVCWCVRCASCWLGPPSSILSRSNHLKNLLAVFLHECFNTLRMPRGSHEVLLDGRTAFLDALLFHSPCLKHGVL